MGRQSLSVLKYHSSEAARVRFSISKSPIPF